MSSKFVVRVLPSPVVIGKVLSRGRVLKDKEGLERIGRDRIGSDRNGADRL